jgi:hypothetical protein
MEEGKLEGELWRLPSEALGCLTSFLSSADIYRLFCCGERILTSQLSKKGAVSTFKSTNRVWRLLRSHLRFLHVLSLEAAYHPRNSLSNSIDIASNDLLAATMPTTLRKLQVLGMGDRWLRTASSEPSRVSYYNLSSLFPNLQYLYTDLLLSLEHTDWVATWPESLIGVRFHQAFVPLPDHVREFSMNLLDENFLRANRLVSVLPEVDKFEVIETMDVMHHNLLKSFIEELPFTLTTLILPPYHSALDIAILPDTLTHLDWKVPLLFKSQPEDVIWPPNLRELLIGPFSSQLWARLPATLTSLTIHFHVSNLDNHDLETIRNNTARLPQSLTSLKMVEPPILFCPFTPINFPQLLRCLHVATYNTSAENVSLLPSNLTELAIGKMGAWHVRALPRSITKLEIVGLALEFRLLEHLPPSLTEFTATICTPYPAYAGAMASLHPETPLWPPRREWNDKWLQRSKDVQEVSILLPRGLTKLILKEVHQLEDWFTTILPEGLTHLELPHEISFSDTAFEHLPPALTLLSLPSVHKPTSQIFAALPRRMKVLDLSKLEKIDNDAHIEDLPRGITNMNLDKAPLSDLHLTLLPPNLREARFGASNFSTCPPFLSPCTDLSTPHTPPEPEDE